MPLTMPLPVADFLDQLPISLIDLDVPDVVMASRTEGGDVLIDVVGTPLWRGEVTLGRMLRSEARKANALITVAQGGDASFMCYDVAHPSPASDPGGALVASASPVIRALVLDRRLIALQGFPSNYRLELGDYISFQYGTNPVRTAFHQVVETEVIASAGGVMPFMEVRPLLEPGAVVGAAVLVSKPAFKAVILPGTVQRGRTTRFVTEGISFQFMQTLR